MLADTVLQRLPSLRRLSRAMVGRQDVGDLIVAATLERLSTSPRPLAPSGETGRIYKCFFETVIRHLPKGAAPNFDLSDQSTAALARLASLSPAMRFTFLLATMECLPVAEIAQIRGLTTQHVERELQDCYAALTSQLATSVLIIEDDPFLAADLEVFVQSLGHRVTAKAATHSEAVRAVKIEAPGLILSDVQLADGSSGIDAIKDILTVLDVPVIFVTSFPERLLTGDGFEPAFLIEKPIRRDDIVANVSLALFFSREPDASRKSVSKTKLRRAI